MGPANAAQGKGSRKPQSPTVEAFRVRLMATGLIMHIVRVNCSPGSGLSFFRLIPQLRIPGMGCGA